MSVDKTFHSVKPSIYQQSKEYLWRLNNLKLFFDFKIMDLVSGFICAWGLNYFKMHKCKFNITFIQEEILDIYPQNKESLVGLCRL